MKNNKYEGNISEILSQLKNDGTPLYQKCGIDFVDKVLNGIMPGEILTLIGDSGSGRTGCSIRMIDYLAVNNSIPVLYFCCNHSTENMLCRILCFHNSIDFQPTLRELRDKQQTDIDTCFNDLSQYPIYIYSASHFSIEEIAEICRDYVERHKVKVVFIPMLYLDYNIENGLRLKILARELNISFVILDDIFEFREGLEGVRPSLRDLYYDRMNEYSDLVIGLCDYSAYHIIVDESGRDLRGLINVEVLKGRKRGDLVSFYIYNKYLQKKDADHVLPESNNSLSSSCNLDGPF